MCFKLYSRCIYMNYYVNFTTIFTSSTFVFGSTNVHVFKNPTDVQCIVYSRLYELFPKSLLPFSALICIFCCWLTCKSVQLLRTADVQTLSITTFYHTWLKKKLSLFNPIIVSKLCFIHVSLFNKILGVILCGILNIVVKQLLYFLNHRTVWYCNLILVTSIGR